MKLTPEDRFRNTADDQPWQDFDHDDTHKLLVWGVVAAVVLLVILAAHFLSAANAADRVIGAATAAPMVSPESFDTRWLYLDAIDLDFERQVDAEAKALGR